MTVMQALKHPSVECRELIVRALAVACGGVQRLQAERAVADGSTVADVAGRFGVHRVTVHRWIRSVEKCRKAIDSHPPIEL